ncbi:MAG: MarC family protein [Tannerellaceae bacterium]
MELIFNWQQMISAFVVLFAVIDITGLIPILLDLKTKNQVVHAEKAAILSLALFIGFLFGGEALLRLFSVDIQSFAVAGALVLFVMAVEMIFGVEIFKIDGPSGATTIVPLVFPLIAGAGSFTTLLSLRAEYNILNILIAIVLNILVVYLVLKYLDFISRLIGKGGAYILKKFFGIILLAIAVKLFASNWMALLNMVD